ncbi:MAG TPA: amidohydrolase family protein, partial [Cyclobacteriaceae bacterium]|nr:amidohydrolase family protein [Cyclobacteriaceae bacterium]
MCFVFKLRLFPCLLFVALMIACSTKKIPADLILRGGKIYTLNDQTPVVEAVAVIADTIAYAGDLAGSKAFEGENTKVFDLGGRTMTPGFIESHGHLMALGHSELELDLDHVKSYEELVDKVKSAVAGARPGEWISGRGWHQDKWSKKPPVLVKGF